MAAQATGGRVDQEFRTGRDGSAELYERAKRVIAGGVTHDIRFHEPFPIMVTHAKGSRKWDVDGNEYVDYTIGHGALLLGHAHPVPTEAVLEQIPLGTHHGASHEIEIAWAEQIVKLIPSAERVRFHSSGTEATQMAMRLARAHTGRDRIVKFDFHFHGWHDYATAGIDEPLDVPSSAGVPDATLSTVVSIPTDLELVREELAKGDVAAVIVEPTGGAFGSTSLAVSFSAGLRELCTEHDTVLIFDEVVTGFRVAAGGFQTLHGITPDMTTLAKIVAGGLPGAACTGKAEIMDRLQIKGDPSWDRGQRVAHPGTFNANPLSAAAGRAVLEHIADGAAHETANAAGAKIRAELQGVFDRHDIGAVVYGDTSFWHIGLNGSPSRTGFGGPAGLALKRALLANGVHTMTSGGLMSTEHSDEDIDRTVDAMDKSVAAVIEDGLLPL